MQCSTAIGTGWCVRGWCGKVRRSCSQVGAGLNRLAGTPPRPRQGGRFSPIPCSVFVWITRLGVFRLVNEGTTLTLSRGAVLACPVNRGDHHEHEEEEEAFVGRRCIASDDRRGGGIRGIG